MKLLILSRDIERISDKLHSDKQSLFGDYFQLFSGVQLEIRGVSALSEISVFDYDVSIIHFDGNYDSFYLGLPKLLEDSKLALMNGRSIICFPGCDNDQSHAIIRERHRYGQEVFGMKIYDWLKALGITLQDRCGTSISSSGAGKALAIEKYLQYVPKYYQIVLRPNCDASSRLAVVAGTEIVVGLEIKMWSGNLVVLPPPDFDVSDDEYHQRMFSIIELAKRYHERAQRAVLLGDAPIWVQSYLVGRAVKIGDQIEKLSNEKAKYDQIAYVLYGTGDTLEDSVELLLKDLGLEVEPQPIGANIDRKAKHKRLGLGFAVEITGTKDAIKKDSKKIAQAFQYIQECVGTPEENNKLIIVANTECHLDPKERKKKPFSPEVVKLLERQGVLLMTTVQLYELWKKVHDKELSSDNVVEELSSKSGAY